MEHNPKNKECGSSNHTCYVKDTSIECGIPCTCPTNQETPESTQEKHECEQGTFCVECGRDNRPQPTSDWELRFDELLSDYLADFYATSRGMYSDAEGKRLNEENDKALIDFIRQIEAQAKEEGRREAVCTEWHVATAKGMIDPATEARLATITLFEEWVISKVIPFVWTPTPAYGEKFFGCCSVCNALQDDPECPHQCEVQNRFCADLLAFADSLKKKV